MTDIQERLFALRDEKYAELQAKLTPTLPKESFIGVRLPQLRKLAAEFMKEEGCREFLNTLPHDYYDENLMHSVILERSRKFEDAVERVRAFLPYVDNWAVCDSLRPKVFAKHKKELLPLAMEWVGSPETYTCRFGIDMLMTHFLDGDFEPEYPELVSSVRSEEYYVNMMVAWYFATALAKQWDAVIPYIEQRRLSPWTHRKAIQKAIESFRITEEQKEYLRGLR